MTQAPMNILLIRGLAREVRHWGETPDIIEERLEGARCHCLDLPGVGTESHRDSPPSVPRIVEDMRARWSPLRQQAEGDWLVFGISFGGMVAMEWAKRHPADFARVVLCNTSAFNLGHPLERLTPLAMRALVRAARADGSLARERVVLSAISNDPGRADAIAADWARIGTETPIRLRLVVQQLMAASRYRAPRRLDVPTMVLVSDNDRFVKASCSIRLAERLGVPVHHHPTAGHALAVDDSAWLADRIAVWLGR